VRSAEEGALAHEAADQPLGFDASNAVRRSWLGAMFSSFAISNAKPNLNL